MKRRVAVGQRVITRVVTERSLDQGLFRVHPALDNDLGVGRDFHRNRLTRDKRDTTVIEEPGKEQLTHVGRKRTCEIVAACPDCPSDDAIKNRIANSCRN